MKKRLLIFGLTIFLVSCNNSQNDEIKPDKNKLLIDSLSFEKTNKSNEIKSLNSELDSLKKLRDSLESITKKID